MTLGTTAATLKSNWKSPPGRPLPELPVLTLSFHSPSSGWPTVSAVAVVKCKVSWSAGTKRLMSRLQYAWRSRSQNR